MLYIISMRKFLLIFFISVFASLCTYASDFDNFADLDHAWDGQKSITNKEFEEAINVLQEKQKKKEAKQKKKKIKKISGGGTSLHNELNPDTAIKELSPLKKRDNEGQLLNIPAEIIVGDKVLEPGFYNIFSEKDKADNNLYLKFYQSQYYKGRIRAYETQDDGGAEDLNFVMSLPYNDDYLKILYGSLERNVYGYVQLKK